MGTEHLPSSIFYLLIFLLLTAGCEGAVSPADDAQKYAQLVRVAAAEVRAEEDTTRLWLRNSDSPKIRALMLDLRLDYLRYDARRGVVCAWTGGGMMPARGFVYRLPRSARLAAPGPAPADTTGPAPSPPADSLGDACYRSGPCSESPVTDDWSRFECP
jgi:hypothetical protein